MDVTLKLEQQEWLKQPAVMRVFNLLNAERSDKDDWHTLFVGGAVRNSILNKPVHDIDLATKFTPDEVESILSKNGVKTIPTGKDHGTITAVCDGVSFEITTLRYDENTDGRHADVQFIGDWVEDAKRRDFTMNALYCDLEGHVYDPLGEGVRDAQAGNIVFVGDAEKRIAEDYLRILRFFRFYAYYGQGDADAKALQACQKFSDKIVTLSRERITSELYKILSVNNSSHVLDIMLNNKVLEDLFNTNYDRKVMQNLCELQEKYGAINVEARLFVMSACQPKLHEDYLRLSHAQSNFMIKLIATLSGDLYKDMKALKKAVFYHGNDLILQGYLLSGALERVNITEGFIEVLKNWKAPKFPVTGNDLMKEGYQTGPELGEELMRRKEEWLEEEIESF